MIKSGLIITITIFLFSIGARAHSVEDYLGEWSKVNSGIAFASKVVFTKQGGRVYADVTIPCIKENCSIGKRLVSLYYAGPTSNKIAGMSAVFKRNGYYIFLVFTIERNQILRVRHLVTPSEVKSKSFMSIDSFVKKSVKNSNSPGPPLSGDKAAIRRYVGEWSFPNKPNSKIQKVRISESEGKVRTRVWIKCKTGLCELGRKAAIKYYETSSGTLNGLSVRYDSTGKGVFRNLIFTALPGNSLEMQELTVFRNNSVKKLLTTNVLVKTDYTILPAPVLSFPKANQKVGKRGFLELGWGFVPGANSYDLQVQFVRYNSKTKRRYWRDIPEAKITTQNNRFKLKIDDVFRGRWRVKANGAPGTHSDISEWRYFSYKMPEFDFYTPNPISPLNNTRFNSSKRTMIFTWTPVARASEYGIIIQYYRNGKWHERSKYFRKTNSMRTSFRAGFQKWRWRVWAIWRGKYTRKAHPSKSSRWMYFGNRN